MLLFGNLWQVSDALACGVRRFEGMVIHCTFDTMEEDVVVRRHPFLDVLVAQRVHRLSVYLCRRVDRGVILVDVNLVLHVYLGLR